MNASAATKLPARWTAGIAVFVGIAVAIYLVLLAWSGVDASLHSIGELGVAGVVMGTALASTAYLVRFARWDALLRWLGHPLRRSFNLRVYLSGLAVTASPGKLGETIRSVFLLPHGVPVSSSLAAFFSDRLSDVAGVACIAVVAAAVAGQRTTFFELVALGVVAGSWFAAYLLRVHGSLVLRLAARGGKRFAGLIEAAWAPALRWSAIWSLRRSLICAVAAFLAYGIQALVFAAYVSALTDVVPVALAVQIFASSTLVGAATMVPAGLGAMEAASVYQLVDAGMAAPDAVAVAIAHRISTLWFGMLLGVISLMSLAHRGPPANDRAGGM
jgi:uncharacterized membrane protein YbhN (UPF0104 family)